MAAEFVSLADLLRGQAAPAADATHARAGQPAGAALETAVPVETIVVDDAGEASDGAAHDDAATGMQRREAAEERDVERALRDARLFGARLADAFDDAAARLVRELAAHVLARELRLAPCDLAALVRRVRERAPIVRVRVAPSDVACVRGVPVVADSELAAGDAVVELAGGALDARLGVRLAIVLQAFA
jgi:hypothetical protein